MAFEAVLAPESSNAAESEPLEVRREARVYVVFNLLQWRRW